MRQVLTVVTPAPLTDDPLAAVLAAAAPAEVRRLGPAAVDLVFDSMPDPALLGQVGTIVPADLVLQPEDQRRKKLLIADMDSTVIEQECLDELADVAGVGPQIAAITERAMRGELDFETALSERLSMLAGLSAAAIDMVLDNRLSLSSGAESAVRTMNKHGAVTALVSGGFDTFVDAIAARCGFSQTRSNRLEIDAAGNLTGRVIPPILGREAKAETLQSLCDEHAIATADALAVGDGANDLAMIGLAGLGVAYRAKPAVRQAADAAIHHTDLRTLLYFQGFTDDEIVP